jgi:hypothetical protein
VLVEAIEALSAVLDMEAVLPTASANVNASMLAATLTLAHGSWGESSLDMNVARGWYWSFVREASPA